MSTETPDVSMMSDAQLKLAAAKAGPGPRPLFMSRERALERLDALVSEAQVRREQAIAAARHGLTQPGEPHLSAIPAGLDLLNPEDVAAIRGAIDAPAARGQYEHISHQSEAERREAKAEHEAEVERIRATARAARAELQLREQAARAVAEAQAVARRLGRPVPTVENLVEAAHAQGVTR